MDAKTSVCSVLWNVWFCLAFDFLLSDVLTVTESDLGPC